MALIQRIPFFLSLLATMLFSQCKNEQTPVRVNNNSNNNSGGSANDTARTYLALGDSYTIGQSVGITERFPAQTNTLLKSTGIKMAEPRYIATTGWRTDDLAAAINSQNPQGPFDVVSLLIGVNDQYQLRDTNGYRERFRQLLLKSISLAGNKRNHVFVLSIPDYSVTPFAAF